MENSTIKYSRSAELSTTDDGFEMSGTFTSNDFLCLVSDIHQSLTVTVNHS